MSCELTGLFIVVAVVFVYCLGYAILSSSQVDTSRFWNNYRHIANALSLYHSVKRLGIPDSQVRSRSSSLQEQFVRLRSLVEAWEHATPSVRSVLYAYFICHLDHTGCRSS